MISVDTRNGLYRVTLRCDGCGREIKNAMRATAFFDPSDGHLAGIYCHDTCAYGKCREFPFYDAWQVHHVLEMLRENLSLHEKLAKAQLELMRRIGF